MLVDKERSSKNKIEEITEKKLTALSSIKDEVNVRLEMKNDVDARSEEHFEGNDTDRANKRNQENNGRKQLLKWNSPNKKKKKESLELLKNNIYPTSYTKNNRERVNKIKRKVNKFYFVYIISTLIHFLTYVNRGIVPGSYSFLSFYFSDNFGIKDIDLHIGLLSSVFILGLSVSSLCNGSLAAAYGIFRVTTVFLFQNTIALLFTGISMFDNTYYFLVFSRFFAGFSEAAFLNCIPSVIYYYSKDKAGAWVSIFFTMFPLGGCIGYVLAVCLRFVNLKLPHYFVIMSGVFLIIFFLFSFFDDDLLKHNEEMKELREKEKREAEEEKANRELINENVNENRKNNVDNNTEVENINNIGQMKEEATKNESSKIKYNSTCSKKLKTLCWIKKKKNSKNKKQKTDNLKQDSVKTNSMETECIDTDDLVMGVEEEKTSSGERVKKNEISQAQKEILHTQQEIEKEGIIFGINKNTEKTATEKTRENIKKGKKEHNNNRSSKKADHVRLKNKKLEKAIEKLQNEKLQNEKDETEDALKEKKRENQISIKKNDNLNTKLSEQKNTNICIKIEDTSGTENILVETEEDVSENSQACEKPTVKEFLYVTICNPCFIFVVIGLTAFCEVIQSNLVYGAPILYSLKVYPSYQAAIVICSLCACASSVIGTCLGGFLLDIFNLNIQKIDKNYEHIKKIKQKINLYQQDILVYQYLRTIGLLTSTILIFTSFLFLIQPFIHVMYPFTILMASSFTLLFLTVTALNIATMVCVPNNCRPFAMGISTFITHIFGDIPWTVVIGKIKSTLAPDCYITKDELLTPGCDLQKDGLTWTLFIMCSKSVIMNVGCLALCIYAHFKIKKLRKKATTTTKD